MNRSFTSSFFGMNTADIRDMKYDQRIFWIFGVPVTVIVFALAYIYGYKGDVIQDSISEWFEARRAEKQREARPEKQPLRAETWISNASVLEVGPEEGPGGIRLRSLRKKMKWRRDSREASEEGQV